MEHLKTPYLQSDAIIDLYYQEVLSSIIKNISHVKLYGGSALGSILSLLQLGATSLGKVISRIDISQKLPGSG